MDDTDSARMLGEVQGSLEELTRSVSRILDNQEDARKEGIAVAAKLESKFDLHALEDKQAFSNVRDMIRAGQEDISSRVRRLEVLPDVVESHGDAILDIEKWRADLESKDVALEAEKKANRRWKNALIGLASLISGGLGVTSGPKFLKWVISLIH